MRFWQRLGARPFTLVIVLWLLIFGANPAQVHADQEDSRNLFDQALSSSREGNFVDALPLWNEFLDLFPEDPAALSNRGNVRLALGDPQGAIADQEKAMQLSPLETDPHLNRGTAEEFLQLWEAAAIDYDWVLTRDPENASALYNLGNVRSSQGNWREAEALYSKASIARPNFAMARSSQALLAYQLEDFEKAKKQLRNVIRRYPMMADARAALSALLWREGSFGEAESNWAAASGLDSRYSDKDWLLNIRRWPPKPTMDLMAFLALERP